MRRLILGLTLCAGVVSASLPRHSDAADPKLSRDRLSAIDRAVMRTINEGYPLYNSGDAVGCYRVYQGSLMALSTLIEDATMVAKIEARLAEAKAAHDDSARARITRAALDELLTVARAGGNAPKPLWNRLGGEPAVTAVVHDFVALAAVNPKIDFTRGGKYALDADAVAGLERKLVELISAVGGGPLKYSGRDMKTSHAGMKITIDQFNALAGDLIAVLKKYKVPQAEIDELVGVIAGTAKDIVEVP